MGHHLELEDFDDVFHNLSTQPLIVNDILDTIEGEKEKLDRSLMTVYNFTDLMDTVPRCSCGTLVGQHHIDHDGKGTLCRICNTRVQPLLDRSLEPLVWVRAPDGVRDIMDPHVWRLLSDIFDIGGGRGGGFNIIEYLTNTNYRYSTDRYQYIVDTLEEMNIPRGYNNFHDHFDTIIEDLMTALKTMKKADKARQIKFEDLRKFISMYRDRIFSKHIPIHNKTLLVIENTNYTTYMDNSLKVILDAVRNISGIDSEIKAYTIKQKENRVSKLIKTLSDFAKAYEKKFLASKPGLLRKHVFASRCWFSFRAVINSLTTPHDHDEIHIPWPLAVTALRIHLMSKLYRKGYGYNDASYLLNEYTHQYHPLLDELFVELIDETKYKGIPCIFGRNPSMYRTSIQRMFITKVKTNPKILSISYPIISVAGPNADFDGDSMFSFLTLDNWTTDELRYLAPHFGAWKLSGPREVGDNMKLPKPIVSSIINWIYDYHDKDKIPDPYKMEKMHEMFSIRKL